MASGRREENPRAARRERQTYITMKILIVTESMYGAWFSLRLEVEGHDVTIYYHGKKDNTQYVLDGLIRPPSKAKPNFADYDFVLFDLTGQSNLAVESLKVNECTIGDSDLASELEEDRMLGIQIMEECGINVPVYEQFNNVTDAKKFIRQTEKRYVFKPNGGQEQDTANTYVAKDAEDLITYLDKLTISAKGLEFILQEVVEGTEISTEGWFNGEDFYLINSTLEEKKFMEGNKGPATGCSGNVVWVYDDPLGHSDNAPLIFRNGLGLMKDFLKEQNYRGPIDLNTIVSDTEIYGLEWTPRLGYDAAATLLHCIGSDIGEFLYAIASGNVPVYQIKRPFASGIRISIPPYPSEIEGYHPEGIPIHGIDLENEEDLTRIFYLYDACLDKKELVTAGVSGFIAVVMAGHYDITNCFDKVYERIKRLEIPNMQYRSDIGTLCAKRYHTLSKQGWLR